MRALPRELASAAMLALMAGSVGAETVSARLSPVAGDERRFVLDSVPRNGWMVRQSVEMIELRFPGYLVDITMPSVVRPPLEDLSTEIKDGDTYLRLTIACDCSLSVALLDDGSLAIDLVEARAVEQPPAPARAPFPAPRGRIADERQGERATAVDVAEARKRMIAQLLRAAEAGLIELNGETLPMAGEKPAVPRAAPRAADDTSDAAVAGSPSSDDDKRIESEPLMKPAEGPNRQRENRAERERAPTVRPGAEPKSPVSGTPVEQDDGGDPVPAAQLPARCHAAATFDLPRLKSANDWVERVGHLRTGLIGEFDRTSHTAVLDLGRTYLSAGLADEALAIFAEFGDGDAEAAVLAEVALVIAGKTLPNGASLLREDCLGPQALWRALALGDRGDHDAAVTAEQSAGRALEKIPLSLRNDLAARLGLAAADAGRWEAARRLHALAGRTGRDHLDSAGWAHLLAARIARWKGDEAATIQALTLARAADPKVAAAATLMLAETVLKSDHTERAGMTQLIVDLGLLARVDRGTAVGARAAALEVRLTDLFDGRARAIDLLTLGLALRDFTEETFTRTLSAMAAGDEAADRNSIAAIYLDDPAAFASAISDPGFRAVLARSLTRLGLPAQAARLYSPDPVPADVAIVLANGYLDVGDRRSAIALIADLPDSPERDRLRRAAMDDVVPPRDAAADGKGLAPERLIPLARMAIAAGDLRRALDLTLRRFAHDGSASTAETVAMIALALGRSDIPEPAASRLKQADPDLHARLVELFSVPPTAVDPADPASTAAFMKRLDAEIAVIEDALDDG